MPGAPILVVGSTGVLGGEVCRLLSESGRPVRALVRPEAAGEKLARLAALNAEVVTGDLKNAAAMEAACRGAFAVISTATSMVARRTGDTISSVDGRGQLGLVAAAVSAGVERFVFVSFPPTDVDFPLQRAKRAVEARLAASDLAYTVLQSSFFMETWLSPGAGFDAHRGEARLYGTGTQPVSFVSYRDVARTVVASLDADGTARRTLAFGGPDALSPLDVVKVFQEVTGKHFAVTLVGERALEEQMRAASSEVAASFAALGLFYAHGCAVDSAEALRLVPLDGRIAVRDFARAFAPRPKKTVARR